MRAFGQVVQVHGIPPAFAGGHQCARSSKRAGGFILRIALDQCRDPERYRTRVPFCPHSSKHQSGRVLSVRLSVRVRLGTPIVRVWFNSQNAALPRPRRRCDSVHPLHFRGRSSSAERSFDMREAKRAALFVPTIFEGIAQPVRADASHASGRRREPFCPHHFCPCGVVQSTCLPLMQEITGAKPVGDANFISPSKHW